MGRFDALTRSAKPAPTPSTALVETLRNPENLKTGNPENLKSFIPENLKEGKQESSVSRNPDNLKTRIPENPKAEKYSTQLAPSLIKQIKQYAIEHDVKDYEVVQQAIQAYLTRKT
jgi:hypothetical protein